MQHLHHPAQRALFRVGLHEEAEAVQSYRTEQGGTSGTSLGELLKAQIGGDRDRG